METTLRDMELRKNLVEMYNKNKPVLCTSNNPEALYPKRIDDTDCVFPISIVSRTNNRIDDQLQNFNEFSTDLHLSPPPGYFVEINGTDELQKRGYALLQPKFVQPRDSNSILKVLLYKLIDNEDLQLPFPIGLVGVVRCANYTYIRRQKGSEAGELPTRFIETAPHLLFTSRYEAGNKGKAFFE
jgi:hypothetical protein